MAGRGETFFLIDIKLTGADRPQGLVRIAGAVGHRAELALRAKSPRMISHAIATQGQQLIAQVFQLGPLLLHLARSPFGLHQHAAVLVLHRALGAPDVLFRVVTHQSCRHPLIRPQDFDITTQLVALLVVDIDALRIQHSRRRFTLSLGGLQRTVEIEQIAAATQHPLGRVIVTTRSRSSRHQHGVDHQHGKQQTGKTDAEHCKVPWENGCQLAASAGLRQCVRHRKTEIGASPGEDRSYARHITRRILAATGILCDDSSGTGLSDSHKRLTVRLNDEVE